jgi:glycosyltransferase involved in cell wall biosynthesis
LAGKRVVTDYVDVEYEGKRTLVAALPPGVHKLTCQANLLKLLCVERVAARQSWRVVVCKPEDAELLMARRQTILVPNGTDVRPDLSAAGHDPDAILFTGTMDYPPNVHAACWFAGECLPAVDAALGRSARFDVVGRNPTPQVAALARPGRVVVHGTVPELTDYYRRAAIVVAPIRGGAGTKLKVLEALAYGKPLVATYEAVRGHGLRLGVDYLPAETPAEFAEACARLLDDPTLRATLGRAGRERVLQYHTWDGIGDRLNRALGVA